MTYVPTEIDYEGSDADRLPDMGQKVNTNLNDIEAEFAAWMGAGVCGQFAHIATDFIGGTTGCLDNIDATDITDGEKAIVVVGTAPPRLYFYRLKSPDTTTESSPDVIQPDVGGSSKRWRLAGRTEHNIKSMGSAPTVNDDIDAGFLIGDAWQYSDTIYFCIDNASGAAEWIYIPPPSGVSSHHATHEDGGTDEITKLKDDIQAEGAIDLKEISTPSAPASGRDKLYTKSGGGLYTLDSGSNETQLLDDSILDTSTGHDHDGADSKTVDHSNLANVTANQHHNQSHSWEGGDHSGTLNESTVTFDNSTGHTHDGTDATVVDHADLGNVTANQHHNQSHSWEGGDHSGTLNESTVTFDNSTGHSHDGSDSTAVDHADLSNVSANQHHNEDHASRHIDGGADAMDGDKVEITWTGYTNYTPSTSPSEVDQTDQLTAHLAGINAALTGGGNHASTHIDDGSDEIDGDKLSITWTGMVNYTPATTPSECDSTDDLTAHLYGIDQAIGGGGSHASSHIDDGSDEIDGDKLSISWASYANYTPSTSPTEVDSIDDLTAHLYGIDAALGTVASLSDTEPGAVSSSSSGQAGTGTAASRDDHSHDLGTHAHSDAASGGQISHANLTSVSADQHHNQSHTWEGGDHTGTLNESSVTFNTSTGHDHDGVDAKTVDHANLTNVTANQHHNQLHASTHISGGGDEIDGDEIDIDYSPTNYTASTSALDDHLGGIDTALGSAGGGAVHDVMGGRLVAASDTSLKWEFCESNQVTLWNDTTRTLVSLATAPTLTNTANDLDSSALASGYNYDIFLEYSSATAANLVAKKWTDDTTRAVVPEFYNGTIVYDADTAAGRKRRFVGTIRMASGPKSEIVLHTIYGSASTPVNRINYSYRLVVDGSKIPFDIAAIRVGFSSTLNYPFNVDNASVGIRDTGANTTATPTEFLFSSASGFSIATDSAIFSDWLTFSSSAGDDLIVIFDVDSANGYLSEETGSGHGGYYKSATNSYDQSSVTGFTDGGSNFIASLYWVEIRSATGVTVAFRADKAAQFVSNVHHPARKPIKFINYYHGTTSDAPAANTWERFLGGTDNWQLEYVDHGLHEEGLFDVAHSLYAKFSTRVVASSQTTGVAVSYDTSPLPGSIVAYTISGGDYDRRANELHDYAKKGYRKLYPLQYCGGSGTSYAWSKGPTAIFSGEIEG